MKNILQNIKLSGRFRQNLIEYGTATILIALVIWFLVNRNTSNNEIKEEVRSTNKTVKKLQSQVDSVIWYQSLLMEKAENLESSQEENNRLIEQYNYLLIQNKTALEKIRLETNEKINNASRYNRRELDSFFAERYQGYK
jgi:hypothetical protein